MVLLQSLHFEGYSKSPSISILMVKFTLNKLGLKTSVFWELISETILLFYSNQ